MKQLVFWVLVFLAFGCANQTTPTGGPKDEAPPELIGSNPVNGQKNFKATTIQLSFNEDIKLKDAKEEILITPSPGKNTKFTMKRNKVTIEPENPWFENTTYSINFRDGIQDLTEGNPAENLRLAFSTGATIDSLSIQGSVRQTFSQTIPEKITVALYQRDTFNIFNHAPTYFTKTNKEGKFSIQNLKSGQYYVYAFDDKNKNLKVESKTERFGFLSNPITLKEDSDSLNIYLINVDTRPPAVTSIRHTEKTTLVRINKNIDSLQVKVQDPTGVLYTFGENQNEVIFYQAFDKKDSVKVNVHLIDSVEQALDTTFYLKASETKMAKETFSLKDKSERYYISTGEFKHTLSFSKPISTINFDSIYIQIDTLTIIPVQKEHLTLDTLRHTLTVKRMVEIKTDSAEQNKKGKKTSPFLRYGKGAFISIDADSSKRLTKNITILKEDDTGLVTAKIKTSEKNYLIQLITSDNQIVDELYNAKDINFKYLKPQEYKIRIIIDSNANKKWDSGNFKTAKEPEKVIFYKSDEGKYSFPIRANWEYGPLLIEF